MMRSEGKITRENALDIIKKFADDNDLPRDWMNSDFIKTASYSTVLSEVSKHFCTLNNGTLEIRTVSGVYLIAMKLMARRDYRNDISDAVGILIEERDAGKEISFVDDGFLLGSRNKAFNISSCSIKNIIIMILV